MGVGELINHVIETAFPLEYQDVHANENAHTGLPASDKLLSCDQPVQHIQNELQQNFLFLFLEGTKIPGCQPRNRACFPLLKGEAA